MRDILMRIEMTMDNLWFMGGPLMTGYGDWPAGDKLPPRFLVYNLPDTEVEQMFRHRRIDFNLELTAYNLEPAPPDDMDGNVIETDLTMAWKMTDVAVDALKKGFRKVMGKMQVGDMVKDYVFREVQDRAVSTGYNDLLLQSFLERTVRLIV